MLMRCSRVLAICSFFFSTFVFAAPADSFYFSVDNAYAGISSQEDFTNGAQDNGTGVTVGYRFTEYNLELTYRKFGYTNTHFRAEDNVDVTDYIEDTYVSFGIRGSHNEYFESKFGISLNNVEGTFIDSAGDEYFSPVDGFFLGLYFGTGPKIPLWENLDFFFDFTMRRITKDILTVGYDTGLRFYF